MTVIGPKPADGRARHIAVSGAFGNLKGPQNWLKSDGQANVIHETAVGAVNIWKGGNGDT